jgi:hypothetical protein
MSQRKIIRNADEACEILKSLMETPQLVSLHFEFDIGVNGGPIVDYRIKRFADRFTEDAEDGE